MKIVKLVISCTLLVSSVFAIDYKNYEFGNEDNEKPSYQKNTITTGHGVTQRKIGQRNIGNNLSNSSLERLKMSKIEKLENRIECVENATTQSEIYNCGV